MTLGEIVAKLPQSYYQDDLVTIYHGDCRDILPSISGISAVVTDPPYELGFMGKSWDSKGISFQVDTWRLVREACLPGAMLLSFGGTRTFHRIACAIEDAGWQIRDTIMWVYSTGFPKSLDIGKALDGILGKQSKGFNTAGGKDNYDKQNKSFRSDYGYKYIPATPEAKLWEGYGTALKPAYEPIIVAMKPIDGTFANNALKHKVAGLNVDECRVKYEKGGTIASNPLKRVNEGHTLKCNDWLGDKSTTKDKSAIISTKGRFPANFILGYPEDEYELKDGITTIERENVVKWLYENT